jgi:hypothetical protein
MKTSAWDHAVRCEGCADGRWQTGLIWVTKAESDANPEGRLVCAKCGATQWCRDIGRTVSPYVWWNPFTWGKPTTWEWKGYPPKALPAPPIVRRPRPEDMFH